LGIGGIFLVLVLVGFMFLRQHKMKAQHNTVVLEQKLLRSQMNPHFIFNSLANIQEFIWNKDAFTANEYLSSFSKLVRLILENSRNDFVPVEKEISTIQNYLTLQKLRYSDKLEYTIEVDPKIDEEEMLIPPMLVQPFIENSIEHGISGKETTGHIHVKFSLEGDQINIEVKDDGIGFKKSSELKKDKKTDHQSLAMTITQERLLMHYKKYKRKIQLTISDLMDDNKQVTGAKVIFGIPYQI
jgi:sensor histidine kinase YesM